MDAKILQAAAAALAEGRPVWLVTVAAAGGSTPQRPGAWMAVDETELLAGTIGGGALNMPACSWRPPGRRSRGCGIFR